VRLADTGRTEQIKSIATSFADPPQPIADEAELLLDFLQAVISAHRIVSFRLAGFPTFERGSQDFLNAHT
jgi:hypothetical protein